jgi:hypothetical protein
MSRRSLHQRRVRREVADIEHRPQQFEFRHDGLCLRLLRGLAAKLIVVEDGATLP